MSQGLIGGSFAGLAAQTGFNAFTGEPMYRVAGSALEGFSDLYGWSSGMATSILSDASGKRLEQSCIATNSNITKCPIQD